MKLYRVRGGSLADLHARRYELGIGISVGNKWFTAANVCDSINWALPRTRSKVIVYVADTLHRINLQVRNGYSEIRALNAAVKMGDRVLNEVQSFARERFTDDQLGLLHFITWNDIATPEYNLIVNDLYHVYSTDDAFRAAVTSIVKKTLGVRRGEFTYEQIRKLGSYVIEELPELVSRVEMAGQRCDAYIYPRDTCLTRLVDQIQRGIAFPAVRKIALVTEPKVFIEVR